MSVVGHDDLWPGLWPDAGLTTLRTPMAEMGKAAVELALSLIGQGGQVPPRQVFRPALVVRGTTAPPPPGQGGQPG